MQILNKKFFCRLSQPPPLPRNIGINENNKQFPKSLLLAKIFYSSLVDYTLNICLNLFNCIISKDEPNVLCKI